MKQKDWFRPKGYAHFSKKINKNFASSFVKNTESVSKYAFYPLIHNVIVTRRYKKVVDSLDGRKRAHSYLTKSGIIKATSKERKIYYANHLDSQIYSYYANEILSPEYEKTLKLNSDLSDCVSAYRRIPTEENKSKNKGNIHFAKDVFDEIKRRKDCVAIAFDISDFFDSISHEKLKTAWEKLLNVSRMPNDHYNIFRSLTNFSYVVLDDLLTELKVSHPNEVFRKGIHQYFNSRTDFKNVVRKGKLLKRHPFFNKITGKKQGIPQGTPISALLANLYLLEFDKDVLQKCKTHKSFYRRYSDDIVIIFSFDNYSYLKDFIINHIRNFDLDIQETKTQCRLFLEFDTDNQKVFELRSDGSLKEGIPFEYLGFEFNGLKPLIKKSSISKFYREAKSYVYKRVRLAAKEQKYKYLQPNVHKRVFRRGVYQLFTHLGTHGKRRNYVLYANEASTIFEEPAIKKQLSKSWNKINNYLRIKIEKKNIKRFNEKI